MNSEQGGPIRWGFIGLGRMAANVAGDWANQRNGELHAVASRSLERAEQFASRFGAGKAYGSYAELLADPQVDAVYVATPHSVHTRDGLAAIAAGKPLLMEKAFTATLDGAQQLVRAAREAEIFAMEAMWTRFQPAIVKARELIEGGAIGEVRTVHADLGVARPVDASDRLFALELGGGTLLDLGVYVVNFAQMILGKPQRITASGILGETGVDVESSLMLEYDGGRTALLSTSFLAPSPGYARVFGTQGWIDVPPRFHHPDRLVLHRTGAEAQELVLPPRGAGYAHEFDEVSAALGAGQTESQVMPLQASLEVQEILQTAADAIGVPLHELE